MDISRADRRGRLRQSDCSPVRRPRRRRGPAEALGGARSAFAASRLRRDRLRDPAARPWDGHAGGVA